MLFREMRFRHVKEIVENLRRQLFELNYYDLFHSLSVGLTFFLRHP
jgi:hypothetical protein